MDNPLHMGDLWSSRVYIIALIMCSNVFRFLGCSIVFKEVTDRAMQLLTIKFGSQLSTGCDPVRTSHGMSHTDPMSSDVKNLCDFEQA